MSRQAMPHGPETASNWEPRSGRQVRGRLLMYTPPWAGWLLLLLVSAAQYLLWGGTFTSRPFIAAGNVLATGGLSAWTWYLARSRSDQIRTLATATVALAGLWVTVASLFPPFTRPLIDLWGFVGFVACLFWSARRAMLAQKGQPTVVGGAVGKLMTILDGARMGNPKVIDGQATGVPVVEVPLEVDRGRQTVSDLQKQSEHIEVVLGQREGSVTISKDVDAGDAGRAVARFVPVDPLETPTLLTGPDRPGTSIAEPIWVGNNEDGTRREIYLVGSRDDSRALPQWLIAGVTGSAKSSGMKVLATSVLCRREVAAFAADAKKGRQTLGPLLGGLERVALDEARCRAMARAVKAAIPARADWLGEHGFEQWVSGCGLTFLVVFFEEARWLGNSSDVLALVEAARSVGIAIFISMQRPSHSNLDTDTRAQLTGRWCFGVEDDADAAMALSDEVLDAGAAPQRWSNRKPGYSYLVAPGVPERYWAMPMRILWPRDDAVIAEAVAGWAHVRSLLDDVTRRAMGALYEQCHSPLDDAAAVAAVAPTAPSPARTSSMSVAVDGLSGILLDPDDDLPDDLGDEGEPVDDGQSDDDGLPPLGPDITETEPGIGDPDAPIGEPPEGTEGFRFGEPAPGRKLSTEDARQVVQHHLWAALDAGKTQVTAAEVDQMKPRTTRSREWVRKELERLCEAAGPGEVALRRDLDADRPGVFDLRAPVEALAGAR